MTHRIAPTDAKRAIELLFVSKRLSKTHARSVADALVETSLDGIDTHGLRLLPTYLAEIEGGRSNARPAFRIEQHRTAAGVFDADNALGIVAATIAMGKVVRRARCYGIAALAVSNSNHFGAAGYYAKIAAANDQVGFSFSNSDSLVKPQDGSTALNGTNPIAIAVPSAGGQAFVLDMATSHEAFSKLLATGQSPKAFLPLAPLGGYKGQGLGMVVQILCAGLADMPFDSELTHLYEPPYDTPRRVAHFLMAIDPYAFIPTHRFKNPISKLLNRFRSSRPSGDKPVLVPGDPERITRAQRSRDGIPVDETVQKILEPYLSGAPSRRSQNSLMSA